MTEKLRGILIDPYQKSITEVHVGEYPAWKELIEVDMICAVTLHWYDDGSMETLWIDDEGLLNEKNQGPFFSVTSHPQPLAGKGIIFKTDVKKGSARIVDWLETTSHSQFLTDSSMESRSNP